MNRILTIAAAALTAATVLIATAQAAPAGCDGPGAGPRAAGFHHGGPKGLAALDRMEAKLDRIDLSDEQREKVRSVIDAARPEFRKIADALRANHKEMRSTMRNDEFDEQAVRRVADRQGDLIADMIVLRGKLKSQVAAVLTPEQRQELHRGFGPHHMRDAQRDGQTPDA
jgi:Spy/CpxP family protein refolding chaperone